MSDNVNKVEISGVVKWQPRVFEPREEGQKVITVFAVEWVRPKSDNKRSVFHVKTFGDVAAKLRDEKLSMGDTVLVSGSLNESKWKDKQTDEWKTQVEAWANTVEIKERVGGDLAAVGASSDDSDVPF